MKASFRNLFWIFEFTLWLFWYVKGYGLKAAEGLWGPAQAAAVGAALGRAGRGGPRRSGGDPALARLAEEALEEAGELGAVVDWYRGLIRRTKLGAGVDEPVLALPGGPAAAGGPPARARGSVMTGSEAGLPGGGAPDLAPSGRTRSADSGGGPPRERMRALLEEAEPVLAPAGRTGPPEGGSAELAGALSPVRSPQASALKGNPQNVPACMSRHVWG